MQNNTGEFWNAAYILFVSLWHRLLFSRCHVKLTSWDRFSPWRESSHFNITQNLVACLLENKAKTHVHMNMQKEHVLAVCCGLLCVFLCSCERSCRMYTQRTSLCVCVSQLDMCACVYACCFDISPIGSPDMNSCFDPVWIRQHHPSSSAAALNK